MLPWIHSHAPLLIVLAIALVSIALLPLARAKVLALRAYRARQSADAKGAAAIAVGASLDALTALAATLVLSTEAEVRDLKDPSKPGAWNPAIDGPRYLRRVVTDLWHLGGDSLTQLRALTALDIESTTKLLERIAEAQVQKLRTPAPVATTATPAELAGLVAEILRDPTTSPMRAATLPLGAPSGQRGSVDFGSLLYVAWLLAVVFGVGLGLMGCPNWNRPACGARGEYSCVRNQPHYCAAGTGELTPMGDEPCDRTGRVCVIDADGVGSCAPAADGGAR